MNKTDTVRNPYRKFLETMQRIEICIEMKRVAKLYTGDVKKEYLEEYKELKEDLWHWIQEQIKQGQIEVLEDVSEYIKTTNKTKGCCYCNHSEETIEMEIEKLTTLKND